MQNKPKSVLFLVLARKNSVFEVLLRFQLRRGWIQQVGKTDKVYFIYSDGSLGDSSFSSNSTVKLQLDWTTSLTDRIPNMVKKKRDAVVFATIGGFGGISPKLVSAINYLASRGGV